MVIFQRLVTLSLFFTIIVNERSTANPTSTAAVQQERTDIATPGEELQENHEEENLGTEAGWECQEGSAYVQEQIALTTKMLDEGEKRLKLQENLSADETILVLGKAGSGKTSLVNFLVGNPKLLSKQVEIETGEYILDDGEKIGTSATDSFTLYPELVSYNSTINFCDSPGFHDSRSSAHEIVSMDSMKNITDKFKKAKILLLENHASLQYGVSKDNFLSTLRHLEEFMVDIDKYRDSVALIATKTPLTYRVTNLNGTSHIVIVTENQHIKSILEFLKQTEESITKKLEQNIIENEREFYKKVIRLLKSLQSKDDRGRSTRINVFRRPYQSGPLNEMELIEENKNSLLNTVMSLTSIEVRKNDFDLTLSDKAKMYLECLLRLTSDSYRNKTNEVSYKIGEDIDQKIQNYKSFHEIFSDLNSIHEALKELSHNLDVTNNYDEFFEKIHDFLSTQNIRLQYKYNEKMQVLEKYEKMLNKFIDTRTIFNPSYSTVAIRHILQLVEERFLWYQTLIHLIKGLSSYNTQINKVELYKRIHDSDTSKTKNLISLFMNVTGTTELKQFVEALADAKRRSEMEIITNSLLEQSEITCDRSGKLTVEGFNVRLSEINSEHLVRFYCNNITLKEVALMAVDTVFLDGNTNDVFKGVEKFFIAASKWEIIGKTRIVLSGLPGKEITENLYMENGKDGKPGLPGSNGGNFFGVGLHFLNGENLVIESNGGQGGPGVDGGKGDRGQNGRNATEKFIQTVDRSEIDKYLVGRLRSGSRTENLTRNLFLGTDLNETEFSFYNKTSCPSYSCDSIHITAGIDIFREDGFCGSSGSLGGYGGEGGIGGFPGYQTLIELLGSSHIQLERNNGSNGSHGVMGPSGDKGLDGNSLECYNITGFIENIFTRSNKVQSRTNKNVSYWKCLESKARVSSCDINRENNSTSEFIIDGIKLPDPTEETSFITRLLDYVHLLKKHENHTVFHGKIKQLRKALQSEASFNSLGWYTSFFK